MKKIICALAAVLLAISLSAQTTDYKTKYLNLVKRVGPSGVGVENLLDKWAQADSSNADYLTARFNYYYDKSSGTEIVSRPSKKYLGADPVLSLKDSLGNDIYYFQSPSFEEELFGRALTYMDRGAKLYPSRLDFRTNKATALIAYEKDSPDMAKEYILALIDQRSRYSWIFPGYDNVDLDFFDALIQEYCVAFFNIGSDNSREVLRAVSEKMLGINKKNVDFLCNLGSYWLLKGDAKQALKYYNSALKLDKGNMTAIKNCCTYAIREKDSKLLKKYLPMMVQYGTEQEAASAKARLDALAK